MHLITSASMRSIVVATKTFLTTRQAARRLGESQRTIARWCEQGIFEGASRGNPYSKFSRWKIPIEAIEKLEEDRLK